MTVVVINQDSKILFIILSKFSVSFHPKLISQRIRWLNFYHGGDDMIIDYFLPYNNFIVLFCIIILNLILILRRSYWQTFLIGNLLLLAILILIGFSPLRTFRDIIGEMFGFLKDVLEEFWQSIKDLILPW